MKCYSKYLNCGKDTSWLFNGLAIDNQLIGNKETPRRIIFEESLKGSEFLSPIIEAMTKSQKIVLVYRRFSSSEASERVVEPYGLKQSKQRWYLIAKIEGNDKLTVFSLDRIESLSLSFSITSFRRISAWNAKWLRIKKAMAPRRGRVPLLQAVSKVGPDIFPPALYEGSHHL